MAEIKSALEIALARTEDVHSDKTKLLEHDAKQEGKKLVSKVLSAPEGKQVEIKQAIDSCPREKLKWFKEGIIQTLLSNLTLPHGTDDVEKADLIEQALVATVGEKRQINGMFQQLKQFFTQYLQNGEQLVKHMEQQYEPRFQQKIKELSNQIGAPVDLDMHSDPEFVKLLKENQSRLDEQFQEALDSFKQQLSELAAVKG